MSKTVDSILVNSLESGNPYAIAGAAALKGLEIILPKIGAGRSEANVIVPVQHQLEQVLVQVNNEYPMAATARLYQLRDATWKAWTDFKQWVQSQQWSDGRAATQAIDEQKNPYLTVAATIANIEAQIRAGGGSPANAAPATSPIGAGTNSNLLYLGGAAIGAKLLGWL